MKEIASPNHPKPVPNDPLIRKLAILSQLSVFKDIVPGYRIRKVTEKEAAEKVSQMVVHLRDWEHGLVAAYQNYLRCLETELKGSSLLFISSIIHPDHISARSDLAETALKCMCTLLTDLTHFNFRVNLMACIIGQLSRRSWTKVGVLSYSLYTGSQIQDVRNVFEYPKLGISRRCDWCTFIGDCANT